MMHHINTIDVNLRLCLNDEPGRGKGETMGDKGGKKDKDRIKKQKKSKQQQEAKKKEDKQPKRAQ